MSTRCQSCDAEIIWATTENDEQMPVDAVPVGDGNIRLEERSVPAYGKGGAVREEIILTAVYERPEQENLFNESVELYVSHRATCEQAKSWRKP